LYVVTKNNIIIIVYSEGGVFNTWGRKNLRFWPKSP